MSPLILKSPTWQWEWVGQYDAPDLVVGADEVEGHEGEPVDRVDAVGEQDESYEFIQTGKIVITF